MKIRDNFLLCPWCEDVHLTRNKVEIFERNEGEESSMHVKFNKGKVKIGESVNIIPHSKDQGVMWIQFYCSSCGKKSQLSFESYKGRTMMQLSKVRKCTIEDIKF
jgi:hypothetical protein